MKYLTAEPFRIKVVEPIRVSTREQRERWIREADFNVFRLQADRVYVDMLTDSGTSAMSANQWAGMMVGDESYAGCKSFYELEKVIREIMGFPFVQPTHQGRAADFIMSQIYVRPGTYILGNMHFDSFRGHAEIKGATPVDLVVAAGKDTGRCDHPFKGNIDLENMASFIHEHGPDQIPLVIITVTCNNNGGQPVSMENIRKTAGLAHRHGIPVMIDAARFAENCYFIKQREPGYADRSVREIAREMFSHVDGCVMSAKKDGLVNIGGFFCTRSPEIHARANQYAIINEGFITYGGQSGRDMEALARGLEEVVEEDYLANRIGQVEYLGNRLDAVGVPVIRPFGGHGVYIDSRRFCPHIPPREFPGQSIVVELYKTAGVRSVELGSCAFARKDEKTGASVFPELDLVRLAVSRRVYTNRHMDVVANAMADVYARRETLRGLIIIHEGPVFSLRHFTARFAMIGGDQVEYGTA